VSLSTKAKKTIRCKILELRKEKQALIEQEYENYQKYLHGDKSVLLYSATKQQADRFLKRLRKQNNGILQDHKDYPLILRNDVYKANTRLTPYWFRIPVAGVRGKINVPIGIAPELPEGAKMKEAKLLKEDNDFYIYITIEEEIRERMRTSVLGVDVGIHNIATTVNSIERKPRFYGRELRRLRSHFYQLRKNLQINGAYEAVKKIGDKESRLTHDILHKVSREIVDEAGRNNSAIVLGDLKGIRLQRRYSRGFMRKLNSFPFYKLFQFIKYKAQWLDIKVVEVSEAYTSRICHNCHSEGLRVGGKFKCSVCRHEYNSDYNGAFNIMNRGIGQALSQGLILAQPMRRRTR
jgi:putative transposase